jgi:hypothetical protein
MCSRGLLGSGKRRRWSAAEEATPAPDHKLADGEAGIIDNNEM